MFELIFIIIVIAVIVSKVKAQNQGANRNNTTYINGKPVKNNRQQVYGAGQMNRQPQNYSAGQSSRQAQPYRGHSQIDRHSHTDHSRPDVRCKILGHRRIEERRSHVHRKIRIF